MICVTRKGEVSKADDLSLSRNVALKSLPGFFTDDPGKMARFELRAILLAYLNNPNIAETTGWNRLRENACLADVCGLN